MASKKKPGRPQHKIDDETRARVQMLAGFGLKQENIARVVGIPERTLKRRCKEELSRGLDVANSEVANSLFRNAVESKNVAAQIFWLKCKAGWREVPAAVELTGKDGLPLIPPQEQKIDFSKLSTAALSKFIEATKE